MSAVRVKICGITRVEDAVLAASLGASAIGLVFWPRSPRAVDCGRAREIVDALPPFVSAVGVFVDQPADEVSFVADAVGLEAVQLHGNEAPVMYGDMRVRVIKSVPVADARAIEFAASVPMSATVLLDAHDPVRRGGTGRTIDWSIAATIARRRPVVLSGGLTPANVVEAVSAVRPYAVDVSSGVETAPGCKDPEKLRTLFAALHTL